MKKTGRDTDTATTFANKKARALVPNPCLKCGACCAYYRASFYWGECDVAKKNGVPILLTEPATPHRVAMKGTSGKKPRCIALEGKIGESVACNIHPNRASVCRDFEPSWKDNVPNERCDKARVTWGLVPLTPKDWEIDDNTV